MDWPPAHLQPQALLHFRLQCANLVQDVNHLQEEEREAIYHFISNRYCSK